MQINQVTKVEVQKRRADRVNVYLNGEYAFPCSLELVYKFSIKVGASLDMDALKEIIYEENYLDAKNQALKTIEKAFKTEKEMRESLLKKGHQVIIIDRVINFLKEYNFINDEKYTQMYIREKLRSNGGNKIKYSLIKKGIPEELVISKLSSIDHSIEVGTAEKLAFKKYRILEKSEDNQLKRFKKISDYLMRNGYNYEIVESVLGKLKQLPPSDNDCDEVVNLPNDEDHIRKIQELGMKRYNILVKSESDSSKIYRKLCEYLLRRGYSWEQVKITVRQIINDEFEGGEFT